MFAHSEEELSVEKKAQITIRAATKGKSHPVNGYKSEICPVHALGEYCPYEDKCTFAHGEEELQEPVPKAEAAAQRKEKGKGKGKEKGEGDEKSECRFGILCKRKECWYLHSAGRSIDDNPELIVCRFGDQCNRPNCFYKHPDELEAVDFVIFMDEIPMPRRPEVETPDVDREVFLDPFPGEAGSDNLNDFLFAFGEHEEVFQIPGQERGYVLFKEHEDAKKVVESFAGVWSESERIKNAKGHSVHNKGKKVKERKVAYPTCLTELLIGDGSALREMAAACGFKKLNLIGDKWYGNKSVPERVQFLGTATPAKVEVLRTMLEERLAAAHDELTNRIESVKAREVKVIGLPAGWTAEEAAILINAYAESTSVEFLEEGVVKAAFRTSNEARQVVEALEGSVAVGGEPDSAPLRCKLLGPPRGKKRQKTQRPAEYNPIPPPPAGGPDEEDPPGPPPGDWEWGAGPPPPPPGGFLEAAPKRGAYRNRQDQRGRPMQPPMPASGQQGHSRQIWRPSGMTSGRSRPSSGPSSHPSLAKNEDDEPDMDIGEDGEDGDEPDEKRARHS